MGEIDKYLKEFTGVVADGLFIEKIWVTADFYEKMVAAKLVTPGKFCVGESGPPIVVYDNPLVDQFGDWIDYYIDWRMPNESGLLHIEQPIFTAMPSSDVAIDTGTGFRYKYDPPKVLTISELVKTIKDLNRRNDNMLKQSRTTSQALEKMLDLFSWKPVSMPPTKKGYYLVATLDFAAAFTIYKAEFVDGKWLSTDYEDHGSELENALIWTNIPKLPTTEESEE